MLQILLLSFTLSSIIHQASASKQLSISKPSDNFTLNYPVAAQLYPSNHAISPFVVSNYSMLPPGLRIPPTWSFSIGFEWDTFTVDEGKGNVIYGGSLVNGSKLPYWISFNNDEITFDGDAPDTHIVETLELTLHATDETRQHQGNQTFNLTVAEHEWSAISPILPAINATEGTPFSFSLDDIVLPFLLLDGKPVNASRTRDLQLSLGSGTPSWISYASGRISGSPPQNSTAAVIVEIRDTVRNVTMPGKLEFTVPISFTSSFFTTSSIAPLILAPGSSFSFSFAPYLSNISTPSPLTFAASYEPKDGSSWLNFASSPPRLYGTVPMDFHASHVNVTVTANAGSDQSSATSLYLSIDTSAKARPDSSSSSSQKENTNHAKKIIGAVFGVIGGFAIVCGILAIFRRSLGQKALDARVRAGPRSGPKEYVIDQLNVPPEKREKEEVDSQNVEGSTRSAAFIPDRSHQREVDLESQDTSMPVRLSDEMIVPRSRTPFPHTETSPTIPKRKFFAPALQHPSRTPYLQTIPDTPRKVSGSSIRSAIQMKLSALTKSKTPVPPISKPYPYVQRRPWYQPRSLTPSKVSAAPSLPEVGDLGTNHGSRPELRGEGSGLGSDISLEGGVSIDEASIKQGGSNLVDAGSHVWVHRSAKSSVRNDSPSFISNDSKPKVPGGASYNSSGSRATPGHSRADTSRGHDPELFPRSVSSGSESSGGGVHAEASEEAIVQTAYSINMKDRTSNPQLKRYSSVISALDGKGLRTPAKNNVINPPSPGYSIMMTDPFADYNAAETSSRGPSPLRSAIVQTRDARRPVPNAKRSDTRNVSNQVEVGRVTMKTPSPSEVGVRMLVSRSDDSESWMYR